MWEFWISLLAGHFMTGHFLSEFWTLNINHLEVTYGQQLSIMMMSVTEKLEFTPVNKKQPYVIWSRHTKAKKGQVIKSEEEKRFIINSVTFDDEGNYTEWNFWNKIVSINLVKVISKRRILGCMPGKNLSISLDGLLKDNVKLQYSSKDLNLTLVEQGLPVGNKYPGYWGRIHVTTKNIQFYIVDGSDAGKYTLCDRENNTVTIITLSMDGCETKTTQYKLTHGAEFRIKLPIWFKKLDFTTVNEVQSVIWPTCSLHTRRHVKGSIFKRQFIISPVTFNDQGTYRRWNYRNNVSSIYKLEVVYANLIQDCVVGKTLNISLDGLSKDDVTLRFTNQDLNITLVENGSYVANLHQFSNRIQVTSSDIQVLNIDVSDMGNYTLIDREDRLVKVITPNLVYPPNPLLALLLLLCIPPLVCCSHGKMIYKKWSQFRTSRTTTTGNTVKFENQNPLLHQASSSPGRMNSKAPASSTVVTH